MLVVNNMVEHLNLLYAQSKDFVFLMRQVDNEYEYVYTNEAASQMLGCNAIGKKLLEILEEENGVFIQKKYDQAIQENKQIEFEDFSYFKLSLHKHETTVLPIMLNTEHYVLATTKEIAFDRHSEDQYMFMRSVFFKTFLSTVLVKKDGTLIEANPTFLNSFDFDMDSIRNVNISQLPIFTEQSSRQMEQLLARDVNVNTFETETISFKVNTEDFYTYTVTLSPIFRDEEVAGYFIIFQDITAYMIQHEKLKKVSQGLAIFKSALNYTTEMIILNADFTIDEVNEKFIKRTGYTRCELIGRDLAILDSHYHPKEFFNDMWQTALRGEVWRGEVCNRTKDGQLYWVDATVIPLTDEQGQIIQFIFIHINVSDKKQMMIELHHIERTFRLITENTQDLIAVLDREGRVKYSSPSYVRKLGFTEKQLQNMNYETLVHEDSLPLWQHLMDDPNQLEKDGKLELKLQSIEGDVIWTEGNYTFIYDGE